MNNNQSDKSFEVGQKFVETQLKYVENNRDKLTDEEVMEIMNEISNVLDEMQYDL
jgi:hypothetical protein